MSNKRKYTQPTIYDMWSSRTPAPTPAPTVKYRRPTRYNGARRAFYDMYHLYAPNAMRGVTIKRNRAVRALGEREERYVNVGSKGRKNFRRSEIMRQVYNAFAPVVSFEHRIATASWEVISNQQAIIENCLNSQLEMDLHFDKLKEQPPNIYTASGVPANLTQQVNVKHVYEGGSYTYCLKNTCTHTIFLEARVMKLHVQTPGHGVPIAASPFRSWSLDEKNDNNGDSWFLNTNLVNPTNGNAAVSSLDSYTEYSPTRADKFLMHYATSSVDIRPKKSSSRLHRLYDLESSRKMVIKPGETIYYTVNMPKFWNEGKTVMPGDANPIQRYSRVVWFFLHGELVTDTTTDTPLLAPGSVQLTVSCLVKHKFRALNFVRSGLKIVSTATAGTRGGYDNIEQANEATINEETNAEQTYSEIGLSNN